MSAHLLEPKFVTAKAVVYRGRGAYVVISITERQVRAPRAGEVRIKVAAAAVNPTDILLRDPGLGELEPPLTPGMDAAGTIEAVGEDVQGFALGEEVMAVVSPMRIEGGAQAEFVVVPVASVVQKPPGVSFAEAATIPMNGLTALYALDIARLSPGEVLAVTGGAGWLAYQVIVLAKQNGLRVIADAKKEDFDLVRSYGADMVVERGDGFAEAFRREASSGIAALLDTALLGARTFSAIRDCGIYIPVRGATSIAGERGIRIEPVFVTEVLDRTDWLVLLAQSVMSGHLAPRVAAQYAPEDIAEAQRVLLAGGVRGRPVLVF
jgi:NADPH2:quinone reductase